MDSYCHKTFIIYGSPTVCGKRNVFYSGKFRHQFMFCFPKIHLYIIMTIIDDLIYQTRFVYRYKFGKMVCVNVLRHGIVSQGSIW
jgi:hypothetical protein